MVADWKRYQADVANLFCRMGFDAEIEAKMTGARAQHSIDVVVRSRNAGIPTLWIVECKYWKAPVRKEQVMTVGQIAQDVGADRAFLLSESGFQAGAIAACRHSSITLTSLSELAEAAKDHIISSRMQNLLERQSRSEDALRTHLYDSKGQPPQVMAVDMGELTDLLGACFDMNLAITAAMTGRLPVTLSGVLNGKQESFDDREKLIASLERQLDEVEKRSIELHRSTTIKQMEVIAAANDLLEEIQAFLNLVDTMFALPETDRGFKAAQAACLSSMRRIGSLSPPLRECLRGEFLKQVHLLMRILIDDGYLGMIDPERNPVRWNAIKERARARIAQVIKVLEQERNTTAHDLPDHRA